MLPYVAELSHAALAVPSSVRRHRWRGVRVAVLTGIRVPNQSAMRWFTRFAGWTRESELFRIWPRRMVLSHAPAAPVRQVLVFF